MNCVLKETEPGVYTCINCGRVVKSKHKKIVAVCRANSASAQNEPGLLEKAVSVSKAYTKWALSGFRERTDDERFAVQLICLRCDKYDAAKVACKVCGCNLPEKIKMATENCPLKKWPTAEPTTSYTPPSQLQADP